MTNFFKIYHFLKDRGLAVLLVIFFISEAYGKIIMSSLRHATILPKGIKTIILITLAIILIMNKKVMIQIGLIAICFLIGQLCIQPKFDPLVVNFFVKYCFLIVLLAYTHFYVSNSKQSETLFKVFETLILINSIFIVIGFLFNVAIFKTYLGQRFGYNGLFVSSATSTYAYFTILVYLFFRYKSRFLLSLKPLIILISCLLIGTKSLYIILVLLVAIYIVKFTSKKIKIISSILIGLVSLFGTYYVFFIWETFSQIRKTNGFMTALLSYRDQLLINKTLPFIDNNWTIFNYLFGGINDVSSRPQMSFFDMAYFFGLIGMTIYLISFKKWFFNFKFNKTNVYFLSILFFLVFISGNFFLNASVAIYLVVLNQCFKVYNDSM
ncbi:hypothetical protein [Psychroserpens ponticola]|uniref:O-antigen ligase domain-containing protein n=1 Tax=Psychroserpens ponticola TaxID=2932268 RepID=A0ABY7RY05_9FLAO|nr:hypothetical protein [Psychroserpens ponticola]WCO01637.1 hypothetical protein MUN68_016440 [Psychroserpens ponticola]